MSLDKLFEKWSAEILDITARSKHYEFLLDSRDYFDVAVSERTGNSQFHFDCEPNSSKNIFRVLDFLSLIKYEKKYKSQFELLGIVSDNSGEKIFLNELSNKLTLFDLNVIDTEDKILCVLLKGYREISSVRSVMNYVKIRDDKKYYDYLFGYTTRAERDRIEAFFEKMKYPITIL